MSNLSLNRVEVDGGLEASDLAWVSVLERDLRSGEWLARMRDQHYFGQNDVNLVKHGAFADTVVHFNGMNMGKSVCRVVSS